jgi:Glycosyl hydrolases family 28
LLKQNLLISINFMIRICLTSILIISLNNSLLAKKINELNILQFGAVPDGKTLNQNFIQKAIDETHNSGGGTVVVPKGQFLTGSIIMKSNVELYLDEGAVLLGSTDINNYRSLKRWKSLILADGQTNIKISGKGTIDGQGRKLALNIDSLFYVGQLDTNLYNLRRKRPNELARPQLIEFVNCENITISNVTLKNSSCWVQTYELCNNLTIKNIEINSDAYWNNDGIDINDCKNVSITECKINSADDGICLKSTHSESINDSIFIADCTVRSSANAVKFGTSSNGGFRDVKIYNINIFDTFRSAIAIECVDGGVLENVVVKNIFAVNTGNAIFIRLGNRNDKEPTGILKNVTISDIRVQIPFDVPDKNYEIRGPGLPFFHNPFPASITGIPGHPIENLKLENFDIVYPGSGNNGLAILPLNRLEEVPENKSDYPEFHMFGELPSWAFYIRHVNGLIMKNISVRAEKPDYRPAFVFDDVKDLVLDKIGINEDVNKQQIVFKGVKNSKIDKITSKNIQVINK